MEDIIALLIVCGFVALMAFDIGREYERKQISNHKNTNENEKADN